MSQVKTSIKRFSAIVWRRWMITFFLASIALALAAVPGAARLWQYHREVILSGQWWRMLSGHFTHWNADHALWDLVMFAALGIACERISPRRFIVLVVGSALAISGALVWLMPALQEYRGLSGIDSGLFVYLVAVLLRTAWPGRDGPRLAVGIVLLTAFTGKIGYEMATGTTLFVDSSGAGFVPLPLVHAIGGICGALVGLVPERLCEANLESGCGLAPVQVISTEPHESKPPRGFPAWERPAPRTKLAAARRR